MDIRGQVAKVRANREKALFSHLFNKAGKWGCTATQNPCQSVKGFKEVGRSRYITDAEFDQVKAQAHFTVVNTMDLALLTGQRPADVLKLKRTDIRDGALWIVQNKTGARLGIEVTAPQCGSCSPRLSARHATWLTIWRAQHLLGSLPNLRSTDERNPNIAAHIQPSSTVLDF